MNKKMIIDTSYPIDVIVYWVDSNDPEWQKEKSKYATSDSTQESSGNIRYRDWDNLKYLFRGIDKYMPWVHKVFFVTCGHIPNWLNTNNPKLVLIKHSDYMKEDYLPTFSANPIELNFHRIPGLSEHFIVFNDDFFVTRKMRPSDFFVGGIPVDQFMEYPVMMGGNAPIMGHILTNDFNLIGKYYTRKTIRKKLQNKILSFKYREYFFYNLIQYFIPYPRFFGVLTPHFARPYLKSSFEELWRLEGDYLDEVSRNRFRSPNDVNIYIFRVWNLLKGNFVPRNVLGMGKAFFIDDSTSEVEGVIKKRKYKLICINDNCSSFEAFNRAKLSILDSFNETFPEKCSYEI